MNGYEDDVVAPAGHRPVMAGEVIRELITDPSGIYLDATIGGGGHAELILDRLHETGRLVGVDRDPDAISHTARRLERFGDRVILRHADFRALAAVCEELGVGLISGALFDLGLSSRQLDDPARGFAYRLDGPLDLRFDTSQGSTAASWLADASESELADALREFGEERHAARLARVIIAARDRHDESITTTSQLAELIARVVGARGVNFGRTAARVFQALRIVTNDELAAIPVGLEAALARLVPGGRFVVIAYHSLEDRLVKSLFREAARECRCPTALGRCVCGANPRARLVHRRVLRPTAAEVARNPRAKAARLRVIERLPVRPGDRP